MIHLLLIEDDVIDQRAFQRETTAFNWDYMIVDSLQAADDQLAHAHFDVILADYLVRDGTALDILGKYAVPVIVITGAGDEEIAVQAIKAGAYDYLIKDPERHYLKVLPMVVDNAIRQKQLERQAQEQQAFAQALFDTITILTSTLDLNEVLEYILRHVQTVVPHDAATVMLIADGVAQVSSHAGRYEIPEDIAIIDHQHYIVSEIRNLHEMYQTRQPVLIAETRDYPGWVIIDNLSWEVRSTIGVPIYLSDEVIGFLTIDSRRPNQFTLTDAQRLQAFAHHAAVAIQNAQLYAQSKQLAVLEERQRLARDLHDSVTQTLYSANVTAQSVLRLWERDPMTIRDDLVQLTRLTQGALAEMRTLLLELRPQALVETSLDTLIRQLAETVKGRARLGIDLFLQGSCSLPDEVQIAFFRIAQETMNNIVKHAQAQSIYVELLCGSEHVELRIVDDGKGFNPHQDFPNHLGLRIMRERAAEAGVQLMIESEIQQGTSVTAIWVRQ